MLSLRPEADAECYQTKHENKGDFGYAQSYDARFDRVLASGGARLRMVTSAREFAAFYDVLRCFHGDVAGIRDGTSSSIKASNFAAHFIQPPFFSEYQSYHFEYHQQVLTRAFTYLLLISLY